MTLEDLRRLNRERINQTTEKFEKTDKESSSNECILKEIFRVTSELGITPEPIKNEEQLLALTKAFKEITYTLRFEFVPFDFWHSCYYILSQAILLDNGFMTFKLSITLIRALLSAKVEIKLPEDAEEYRTCIKFLSALLETLIIKSHVENKKIIKEFKYPKENNLSIKKINRES